MDEPTDEQITAAYAAAATHTGDRFPDPHVMATVARLDRAWCARQLDRAGELAVDNADVTRPRAATRLFEREQRLTGTPVPPTWSWPQCVFLYELSTGD